MTEKPCQRILLTGATIAVLALAAFAPAASAEYGFAPGGVYAKTHAPVGQPFTGTAPPGATQASFFGDGYETWLQNLGAEPELSQAGAHPDFTMYVKIDEVEGGIEGNGKDLVTEFPAGMVADPRAVPSCELADFHLTLFGHCPTESQVGVAATDVGFQLLSPIAALVPSPGEPALLGFKAFGLTALLHASVRGDGDYGLTGTVRDIAPLAEFRGSAITVWGVPHDPVHDVHRFDAGIGGLGASVPGVPEPFLSTATDCGGGPLTFEFMTRSWENPEHWDRATDTAPEPTGCELIDFDPAVSARPTTNVADSPTGLEVAVQIPQDDVCEPGPPVDCVLAASHLEAVTVALPEGLVVNPSGANGLDGCSPAEVGLASAPGAAPIRFKGGPARCPDASKVASVEIETPLLEGPIFGSAYIADPFDNPFESLLAIYVSVDDPETGLVLRLAGELRADPRSGRLAIAFENAPQLPFERVTLHFKQGLRALLRTPTSCGEYSTSAELTPYAAPDSPVALDDAWSISNSPGGSCRQPNEPSFEAGTVRPIAGVFSPLVMHLRREDGTAQLESLDVSLPPGVAANLSGTPFCSEATFASHDGPPACPAASRVGSDYIGVGAGAQPYFLDPGPIYLAGPYRGAPFSLVVVVPARAGPFDLGTVVTRAAIFVEPHTARARIVVDPLPQILRGIPISYRTVHLILDRAGFLRNPTSCQPTQIAATATATDGATAALSSRFQVADCAALPFRPRLGLHLIGGLARNGHPAVRAVLRSSGAQAGLGGATLTLPRGVLLDIRHVRALCARRLPAQSCPGKSRLGRARLWSPLLGGPLRGPIYLRAPAHGLPDLLADLRLDQLRILLHGHTAAPPGRLRVRFRSLPDLPLSKAVFTLAGGRRGIFVNGESLCTRPRRAQVAVRAHNGKRRQLRPRLRLHGRC